MKKYCVQEYHMLHLFLKFVTCGSQYVWVLQTFQWVKVHKNFEVYPKFKTNKGIQNRRNKVIVSHFVFCGYNDEPFSVSF